MTPMSRARSRADIPRRGTRPQRPIVRLWHAACIGLLACGCLYPFPNEYLPENASPEVKDWGPAPNGDGVVEMITYAQTFHVIVLDAEGDDVEFDWSLSRSGPLLNADTESRGEGSTEVSTLQLSPLSEYDTQTLRCSYWDPEGNGQTQVLEWLLSVPAPEGA